MLVVVYTNSGGEFSLLSITKEYQYLCNRKPRVKRRSHRNTESTFPEENNRSTNRRDETRQKNFLRRFIGKEKRQTKPSNYDISNFHESSNSRTSPESPLNLSNTIFPELVHNSSQQFSVKRLNKNEKPIESVNSQIKPPNENGNKNQIIPSNQNSAVFVRRINKSSKLDEENKDSDNTTEINDQMIPPTSTPITKTDPINVTKIPRNKSVVTDVRHISRQPSVNVKSLRRNRSLSHDGRKNSINGVNVTKISKNLRKNKLIRQTFFK